MTLLHRGSTRPTQSPKVNNMKEVMALSQIPLTITYNYVFVKYAASKSSSIFLMNSCLLSFIKNNALDTSLRVAS